MGSSGGQVAGLSNLANADVAISSRIKTSDGWNATVAGRIDAAVSSIIAAGGIVQSIQYASAALGTTGGNTDVTISSVSTTKTVVDPLGYRSTETSSYFLQHYGATLTLTSATNVRANKQANAGNSSGTVYFGAFEYK